MEHLSSDMEQQEQEVQWRGDKVQELEQQSLQPKRDITNIASWVSYSKYRHIIREKSG
jgi:type IV secretory pathway component VirB8